MAFTFIQLTDHHLTAHESVLMRGFSTNYAFSAVIRHIAAHAAEIAPAFIVSTGHGAPAMTPVRKLDRS